jgi:hypothetical protein
MKFHKLRLAVLLLLLIFSTLLLGLPFFFEERGVIVNFVKGECSFDEGSIITQVKGFDISDLKDFKEIEKTIRKNEHVSMIVDGGPGSCTALENGDLGIEVSNIPSRKLKFGSDIQGSTILSFIIKEKNEVEKIKDIIEKRIRIFGIPETRVDVKDNIIQIITIFPEKVSLLIEKGELEARIEQEIGLENGIGDIFIRDDYYKVKIKDEQIEINNFTYKINQTFLINNLEFQIINFTERKLILQAIVFDNVEIEKEIGLSSITYDSTLRMYRVDIPIRISENASNNFISVTKNLAAIPGPQPILRGSLVYYLDGEELSRLTIPYEMKGRELRAISIIFFANSQKEALNKKRRIEAAIVGSIPRLSFIGETFFPPQLYEFILLMSVIFTIVLVSLTMLFSKLYFKNLKLAPKILGLIGIDIVLLFGLAAFSQTFFEYGWILDLSSIIGIFVFSLVCIIKIFLIYKEVVEREISKFSKYFDPIFFSIGFVSLFIVREFGIALFFGMIIKWLITDPLFKNFIKKL